CRGGPTSWSAFHSQVGLVRRRRPDRRPFAARLGNHSRHHLLGARRMIAVDTNVLVYAHRRDAEWHVQAERALRRLAEGAAPWAVPWPCLHEFLAISTHPRIFRTPTPIDAALDQVDAWLESPSLT